VLIAAAWPLRASAGTVDVVVSRAGEYEEAVTRSVVEALGADVRVFRLDNDPARAAWAAEQVRGRRPRAAVAIGLLAATVLRDGAPDVPLVYCLVDRAAADFDATRAWGVPAEGDAAQGLAALHALLPARRRVAVLYDPARSQHWLDALAGASHEAGVEILAAPVRSAPALRAAVDAALEADVVWVQADPLVASATVFPYVAERAFVARRPIVATRTGLLRSGAVAVIQQHPRAVALNVARRIRALDAGGAASEDRADTLHAPLLTLNERVARLLGITVDDALRQRIVVVR
jgi:ABC-type uncharacterized transport system substrate-binding protein